MRSTVSAGLLAAFLLVPQAATAASCNPNDFGAWLADFRKEAQAAGISARAINAALSGVSYDPKVIAADRRQAVFAQSFLQFAGRMVAKYRLDHGAIRLKRHAAAFSRAEQQYGVPAAVITGFWGLETDYGANLGDFSTLNALATLASDCRRPEMFRPQLMAAVRLVERGDLTPAQMRGAWAGELGQTQLLPSDYLENGVDGDGDGRVDLLKSELDVIATTAKVIAKHGWKRGQPWLEEVRVPAELPWDQADLAIRLPRSQWAQWGVTRRDGSRLSADATRAALLLPMGRNGPAFLAYDNFDIYLQWNKSLVYAMTAAYFATRLAGAPAVSPGARQVAVLSLDDVKRLQNRLAAAGYDVGKVDGIIGEKTRAAVKAVQIKLGLPADSYPTPELLARMGG